MSMYFRNFAALFFCTVILSSQNYELGDVIDDFTAPICKNGEGDFQLYNYYGDVNGGNYRVVWINLFATWCVPCQDEAPFTETIYQSYKEQGLVAIGAGFDWNFPYNCEDWAQTFGITYPVVDDATLDIANAFGAPYIPYHIIIDHTMTLRYSQYGWNQVAIIDTIERLLSEIPTVGLNGTSQGIEFTIPKKVILHNAYPNPFNSSTTILYSLEQPSKITIDVLNALGRQISTLVNENYQSSGNYQIIWNDKKLTSGLYFIRLRTINDVAIKKVILLK